MTTSISAAMPLAANSLHEAQDLAVEERLAADESKAMHPIHFREPEEIALEGLDRCKVLANVRREMAALAARQVAMVREVVLELVPMQPAGLFRDERHRVCPQVFCKAAAGSFAGNTRR